MTTRDVCRVLVLGVAVFAAGSAPGQVGGAGGAGDKPAAEKGGAKPAGGGDRLEIWTEAQPVLEREMGALRKATSMVGTMNSKWEMHIEGTPPNARDWTVEFAVQRPDRLIIRTQDVTVVADGKELTVASKALKQYVRVAQPEPWLLRDRIEELSGGNVRNIPGEVVLRPGMSIEQSLRNVRTIERVRSGDFDGKAGQWVTGTAIDDRTPGAEPYAIERWYSDADGLVYCVKQDWTASTQDQENRTHAERHEGEASPPPARKVTYVRMTTTFTREMNAEIPAGTFAYKPGKDERQVDALVWPHPGMKDQLAMIGGPAPEVSGPDLDGQTVTLSGLRGKVVVMDFWATWCGPCVAGLPKMQELSAKMRDRGVVFLGVNRDDAGKTEMVRKFLERRGVDMRQVLDGASGPASEAYKASTIPCLVIVDREGNVADIGVGYLPGKEKEVEAKLEKVLAGKPVRTAEELGKLREQVGAIGP